ncbi:hypothetical protein BDQ12DRAFT_682389 [Crucibulum laeve]|uniref:Uncharacterized protein n=1 Tax=Crucibulum laeve TaxID=68775 RepID=A0A5C3M324_9AGAR|nr:hypothetical protein BDQ12DRAFT_682389 [Crucibulum laeve]
MESRFVGDKQVDQFSPQDLTKIPDEELTKRDVKRIQEHEGPGAAVRAGAATRNPEDYDTKGRGGQGNVVPQADPVI